MTESKLKPISLGLLAVALWAAIPAFVKVGSTTEALSFLLVLRFAISSVMFATFVPRLWQRRHMVQTRWYLIISLCLGANFYFQGLAMIKLPVSWYLIIFALNPLFALMLMGVQLTRRSLAGVGLAIIGTLMFVDLEQVRSTYGVLPIIYVVIGMLTWVAYTLIARKFQSAYSNAEVTALTQYGALVACLVIWMANGMPVFEVNGTTGFAVLALGTLTPVAFFGFNTCLRTQPRFGIVSQYLEPVFGIFIGLVFFHESLSLLQALGSVLILVGSAATES